MRGCLGTKVWTNKSSTLSTLKGPDPKYSPIPMIASQCQEQTETSISVCQDVHLCSNSKCVQSSRAACNNRGLDDIWLVGSVVIVATCDRIKRNLPYSLCCGVGEHSELKKVLVPIPALAKKLIVKINLKWTNNQSESLKCVILIKVCVKMSKCLGVNLKSKSRCRW